MGPSQRQLRVGEQLRHIISEILQRGHFNNILLLDKASQVTVTEVRPSPDLKHARVYVSCIMSDDPESLIEALNDSTNVFQREIGKNISMKFTPKVRFLQDESFGTGSRIDEILENIPKKNSENE
jgi:ribosome-binding factor A